MSQAIIGFSIQQGEDGRLVIAATIPPPPPEPPEAEGRKPNMNPNPNSCPLSPTSLRIMRLLVRETSWVTADTISRELELPLERKVQPLLTELMERGFLESRTGPGGGYMLTIPDGQEPEAFRLRMQLWLDQQEARLA